MRESIFEKSSTQKCLPTEIKEENEEELSISKKDIEIYMEKGEDIKIINAQSKQKIEKIQADDKNYETNSNGKKPIEKLNPHIKVAATNILNSNLIVNKVLQSNNGNPIAKKLKKSVNKKENFLSA